LAALAAPAVAGSPATGFTGQWQSIDCASLEGAPADCSVWGDGSLQFMTIGPGHAGGDLRGHVCQRLRGQRQPFHALVAAGVQGSTTSSSG
jgi:hypothetical protein